MELNITRYFDESPSEVFRAWTDPSLVALWWGPNQFVNVACKLDVRPGGTIRIDMRSPEGKIFPVKGEYIEVVEPKRLVFRTGFYDSEGNTHMEEHTNVMLEPYNNGTKLTLHTVNVKCIPDLTDVLEGMEAGWNQTLDRLDRVLKAHR